MNAPNIAAALAAKRAVVEVAGAPTTREERVANTVHRSAAEQLLAATARGNELLAKAEGVHGEAAEIAKEVKRKISGEV